MYVSFKMCKDLYNFQYSFKWHVTILQCRGLIWNQMELRHQCHSIISNVIKLIFFLNFTLRYKLNFYKLIPIFKWIIQHVPNMSSSLYSILMRRNLQHLCQYGESLKMVLFTLFTTNPCQSLLESSKVEENGGSGSLL